MKKHIDVDAYLNMKYHNILKYKFRHEKCI